MQVSFDQNGYAYDTASGNLVNLTYDSSGNAIDANTGEVIASVLMPDNQTVYSTSNTTWSQIGQALVSQFGAAMAQPAYTPYSPYGTPFSYSSHAYSPYGSGAGAYGPSGASRAGVGVGLSASGSGIGGSLNLSPTTLLIIGVVAFAFLSGRKGR